MDVIPKIDHLDAYLEINGLESVWLATPESERAIERSAVYGWNPTIAGAKTGS